MNSKSYLLLHISENKKKISQKCAWRPINSNALNYKNKFKKVFSKKKILLFFMFENCATS